MIDIIVAKIFFIFLFCVTVSLKNLSIACEAIRMMPIDVNSLITAGWRNVFIQGSNLKHHSRRGVVSPNEKMKENNVAPIMNFLNFV